MFHASQPKILNWLKSIDSRFLMSGLTTEQFCLLWQNFFVQNLNQRFIFIFPNEDELERSESIFKFDNHVNALIPNHNLDIYDASLPSEHLFLQKFRTLFQIQNNLGPKNIFLTIHEALKIVCPFEWVRQVAFKIEVNDIFPPFDLEKKLVLLGYKKSFTVEEPGSFSIRGEIFDLYTFDSLAFRIYFYDEMIEAVHPLNIETKSISKDIKIDRIDIIPTPFCVLENSDLRINLRTNLPMPSPSQKNKAQHRTEVLNSISTSKSFEEFPICFPLFFASGNKSLLEHLIQNQYIPIFISERQILSEIEAFREKITLDFARVSSDLLCDIFLPSPEYFFNLKLKLENINSLSINSLTIGDIESIDNFLEIATESPAAFFKEESLLALPQTEILRNKFNRIKTFLTDNGSVYFMSASEKAINEFEYFLSEDSNDRRGKIEILRQDCSAGACFVKEKLLLLCESDIFGAKRTRTSRPKSSSIDLFAEKMSTLVPGDFVIHAKFGVGKYLGTESLATGLGKADYFVIEYADKDKVYVPVFKIDLFQKHGDINSLLKVDSLRNSKFASAKKRARESAKKLAFDLLKLNASRSLSKGFSFSPPDHLFKEFELTFPYKETLDQASAIESVLEKMQDTKPMDFLVCGDVGFGKTEIAMRAAFKAVLDKKQVAILTPTTILTLQHYNTFQARFKNFPLKIEFLSRFKTAKESKAILTSLEEGKIDIIIGTHKLLSENVKYRDLGLVIVDEEHRFGVGHKEKLKYLKNSTDFLTLTATPIPRTLQLAFLGLRDMALIRTAPPSRQSIKTYVVHENLDLIKSAIQNEISRGGQVYIVHNKVQDMEIYVSKIRDLVPNITIAYAHGQMGEGELERIINDFYFGKFKVLVSTTIIESGIDVPNANTIIIDRADTFGLAQLHQLRGRIGRSDRKAYAYLLIPTKTIGVDAEKRIKAIQQYAEVGSGFNLASADMEIRGAGDILGAEQSGHIENIGLELYLELLQEAVNELKGVESSISTEMEFNVDFPSFIPECLIPDSSERLRLYKKISRLKNIEELTATLDELQNFYEKIPLETLNLFNILKSKVTLMDIGARGIVANNKSITIKFTPAFFEKNPLKRNKLVEFLLKNTKLYQINQDYSFTYYPNQGISSFEVFNFSKIIAEQIKLC